MAAVWKYLERKSPTHFNHHTLPVWATLGPVMGLGIVWCSYVSFRTLFGHNDIILVTSTKEPYLDKPATKLVGHGNSVQAHKELEAATKF